MHLHSQSLEFDLHILSGPRNVLVHGHMKGSHFDTLETLITHFRQLRVAKRLNQLDIEKRSGVKQPRVSLIERGKVRPSPVEKLALLHALGLTGDDAARIAAASRRIVSLLRE